MRPTAILHVQHSPEIAVGFHERFGANLRQHCYRYASIAEVCRGIDINRQQFNRYLSGKALPNETTLKRICKFLEVDEHALLGISQQIDDIRLRSHRSASGSLSKKMRSFPDALAQLQDSGQRALLPGLHFVYYPFPGSNGFLMRSLLLVRQEDTVQRFTRLTIFPHDSGFPNYIIKSKHEGIVCHNGTQTYLLGLTDREPHHMSLLALNNSDSASEGAYLTGLALVRTTHEFISTAVCIQHIGGHLPIRQALRGLGPVAAADPSVDAIVAVALGDPTCANLIRGVELHQSLTKILSQRSMDLPTG